MKITKNTFVTLDYRVTDEEGFLVDEGLEPLAYLHGGYEDIFKAIELELEGKSVGELFKVSLSAQDAFGEYNEDLVMIDSLSNLPENLEVGMHIEGYENGDENTMILYRVIEIKDDRALLDGNHPLAGLNLIFEGSVKDIRMATEEELQKMLPSN